MGFRTKGKVDAGSKAPDFTLPSQSGEIVNLKGFVGSKPVVLFFYPKDDTPGCTKQACAFRDDYEQFGKLDAEVIGISSFPSPCSATREAKCGGFTGCQVPSVSSLVG
jgi:peroxiredoxin